VAFPPQPNHPPRARGPRDHSSVPATQLFLKGFLHQNPFSTYPPKIPDDFQDGLALTKHRFCRHHKTRAIQTGATKHNLSCLDCRMKAPASLKCKSYSGSFLRLSRESPCRLYLSSDSLPKGQHSGGLPCGPGVGGHATTSRKSKHVCCADVGGEERCADRGCFPLL
jgi:hypothetical protein